MWHDINNPYFKTKQEDEPEEKKRVTGVEEYEEEKKKKGPVADIIEAVNWVEGEYGFTFNENCFLEVKGKFHEKSSSAKITGELWVINLDDTEEDLKLLLEAFLDNNGIAKFKVKLKYGDAYYEELENNINAKCKYKVKNIQHCLGGNMIDSEPLEMPTNNEEVDFDFSR